MSETTRKRRRVLLALLLLLLLGYGGYRVFATNPDVEKVRDLRKELANKDLTPEQRREISGQLREAMQRLSPEDRQAEGRDMAKERQKRFAEQLGRYSRMSPREKTAYLDEQIRRSQEWQRQRAQAGQRPGGPGSSGGTAAGGQANGAATNASRPPLSTEDRLQRRMQRLDDTTPEFRAQLDQYRADMAARRQQLGLPPTPPRR